MLENARDKQSNIFKLLDRQRRVGQDHRFETSSEIIEHDNLDDLANLLARSVIGSLTDLQSEPEFIKLLNSPSPELREEALRLFDEVDSLKDRLQSLLLC